MNYRNSFQRQEGAVLVISLIILTVLTLYAISSSKESAILAENSIAMQSGKRVHYGAELGISNAIAVLDNMTGPPAEDDASFYHSFSHRVDVFDETYWENGGLAVREVESEQLVNDELEVKYFIAYHGTVTGDSEYDRGAVLRGGFGVGGDTAADAYESYQIVAWSRWRKSSQRVVEVWYAAESKLEN